MFQQKKLSKSVAGVGSLTRAAVVAAGTLFSATVMAQQSGSIEGKVFLDEGVEAAGVTVKATSPVMPRGRTATTGEDGEFKLPALIPGTYSLEFTTEDGITRSVTARVLLDQKSNVSVIMVPEADASSLEEIEVTGQQIVVGGEGSLSNALGSDVVDGVPIGTNYRDMMKLIPGVQYTENAVRGANAGGSGQDNTYAFDGVNITLPMFGTLSAEPSNHDIEMVTVERGGANAVGFNRSGGFSVDSKTKSGTNEFQAGFEHKMMPKDFVGENKDGVAYELNQSWTTIYASGPLIEDQLFFYGSYYGPRSDRGNKETAYGDTKDFTSERDEYFGKLTWAPTDDILLNGSFRTSERVDEGASIGFLEADSVSVGSTSDMEIATLDGSWVINEDTTFTAQLTSYAQEGADQPDRLLGLQPDLGSGLDINNLADMGYFQVPALYDLSKVEPEDLADAEAFNAFVQPIINQYGYINDQGQATGGGGVGAYSTIWEQNFYRDSFEMALDHNLEWGSTSHEIHVGFQWNESEEELTALSNGWGYVTVEGGVETLADLELDPADFVGSADLSSQVYYAASIQQMSLGIDGSPVSPINSFTETYNIEVNDKIDWNDFTFNVGFLISQDTLYGEGLREKSGTVSGYELAPGEKYEMYKIDWKDMIQPRLGVTWRYNDAEDTVFFNYGEYNPAVSSLARAASWARNTRRSLDVYFDENGDFLAYQPAGGSSGKAFQKGMKPRLMEEFTLGTTRNVTDGFNVRAHLRYRENDHFWEDVYNPTRVFWGPTEEIRDRGLYIENLDDIKAEIGGSSWVIAEIEDAYTKYWEASLEAEWFGERTYLNASYVRSRYSGNWDQDNTTVNNDQSIFVGSSLLMDWDTLNVWDNREGTLTGDRPHIFKAFGYYTTDWNANVGAYVLYQSGHAWQIQDGTVYGYEPTLSNDGGAYGEKAGSRRTPSHWQLDLNYTQNFQVFNDYTLKFRADLFNVFDRQTGYDPEQRVRAENFTDYRRYYNSRRLQLSFGVDF